MLINFIKENWFKILLLIAIFWLILIIKNGINIEIKDEVEIRGLISDNSTNHILNKYK